MAGDPVRECRCAASAIARCQKRISGPLPDRVDIHRAAHRLRAAGRHAPGEPSAAIRERVETVRGRQAQQYAGTSLVTYTEHGAARIADTRRARRGGERRMKVTVKQPLPSAQATSAC